MHLCRPAGRFLGTAAADKAEPRRVTAEHMQSWEQWQPSLGLEELVCIATNKVPVIVILFCLSLCNVVGAGGWAEPRVSVPR